MQSPPAAPVDAIAADHACLNCGEPFGRPRPRFCPACGQESNVKPPHIREFVQQFGGAYFSTEGAIWRTLKLLLLRPGELTRQYLAGRRKHYVLPLRLYLTISLIAFLMLRLMGGHGSELASTDGFDPRQANSITMSLGFGSAGMRSGQFFCDNLPHWLCEQVRSKIDVDATQARREFGDWAEKFVANLGASMFVILPSLALWFSAVYRNRGMRYTEHLVFVLHLHAFWFIALMVALARLPVLSSIALPIGVPLYTWLAVKRVYRGRAWPRVLRLGLVFMLYLLTLGIAMGGLALWSALF